MSKIVYHKGTDTYMSLDESEIIEVPDHVEDVEQWMRWEKNPPKKEMIPCSATITFYVTAYKDDEDNEHEFGKTKEDLAEDYLGNLAEDWTDLEIG